MSHSYSFFFSACVALLEDEPGVAVDPVGAGALDAPPEGELAGGEVAEEDAPGLAGGGAALPLGVLLVLAGGGGAGSGSSPQAAMPRAMLTAIAKVGSFMKSPC